ncbi:MAG: O-methyltransferase [Parcubacteria group bacterium Greene0416_79]|nr:MAG: O-methyltransferase [Parcubacteria group bacterium Greene0416_79]
MNGKIVSIPYEEYSAAHSLRESLLLRELAEDTKRETGEDAIMQVGHLEGAFLKLLVRISKARRVLELGTFTGYSALAMAEALPDGGELITLDIDKAYTDAAQKFWAKSPHGKKITLMLGPALKTIPALTGPLDMVFIDADKENYLNYWNMCLPKVRQGGLLVVDNVLWSLGNVLHPQDATEKAIAAFNEAVRTDRRVEAVILTIRDGVTVALKR